MKGLATIARRELTSYFRTPAGWVIIALFLLLTGLVFGRFVLAPGRPASLRDFFAVSGWLLLPVAPAISMRFLADEIRAGTIESLLTAPTTSAAIVLGKFLGGFVFLLTMLAPTGLYVVVLDRASTIPMDLGPILAGYLCLVLVGGLALAIGTFASSLTPNSTLAFLISLFAMLALLMAPAAADFLPSGARPVLYALALSSRIADFAKGVIDTAHVAFFLLTSVWFLAGAACVTELRRWR
ncbi:MAG: ABC transporter permease [Planctomycetota bacterium]|nr:ABC transporter permease [Planctomycetota bacterium]